MNVFVSLKSAGGRERLPAAFPIAYVCPNLACPSMRIPQMSLQMIFARKIFVTTNLGTGKWSLLVMAAHVGFEAAGSVKALATAVDFADEVPLPASLAVCSPSAVVGEVDF